MRRMGPSQYGATDTGLDVGLCAVGSTVGLRDGPDVGPRVVGLEVDVGVVGLRVVGLAVVVGLRVVGLDVGLRVVGSLVVGSLVVGSFVEGSFVLVVGSFVVGSLVVGSLVVGAYVVGSFVGLRVGLNDGLRVVGLEVVVGLLVGLEDGLRVVGPDVVGELTIVILNQFIFQPPPVAKMPNSIGPAFRLTVCETVCQVCQPPVLRMLTVPYTCVPPAFSSRKLPPLPPLATRYSTL